MHVTCSAPRIRHRDKMTIRHVMKTLVTDELPINTSKMPGHVHPEQVSPWSGQ